MRDCHNILLWLKERKQNISDQGGDSGSGDADAEDDGNVVVVDDLDDAINEVIM